MKIKETKKLAVLVAAIAFGAGCGKSNNANMTANEDTGVSTSSTNTAAVVPPAAPPPDAVLVEQTTVAVVDTNATNQATSNSGSLGAPAGALTSSANDSTPGMTGATTFGNTAGDTNSISPATTLGSPEKDQSTGAAAGNETGQAASTAHGSDRFIGYEVLDVNSRPVGTVQALWDDQQGDPRYLAIKPRTGDQVFVIPTVEAQQSQQRRALRVPYSVDVLKTAPQFDQQADLDRDAELKVIAFYRANPPQTAEGNRSGQATQQRTSQTADNAQLSEAQRKDEATIRLREEQLKVGKREVQTGGVLLKKIVRTETVNQPVQLKHEELVIQRVPGNGQPVPDAQLNEREVFIPLMQEEPVVQKQVVLKEVVNVGKKEEQVQQEVNAKLREEQLKIERQGQVDQATGAPGTSQEGKNNQQSFTTPPARTQGQQGQSSGSATGEEERSSQSPNPGPTTGSGTGSENQQNRR